MPILTVVVSPDLPNDPQRVSRFVTCSGSLCRDVLLADNDKVQVQIFAAMVPLHGRPVLIEVRYRSNLDRGPKVIEHFMEELDKICLDAFAVQPRIRCFPQKDGELYARN